MERRHPVIVKDLIALLAEFPFDAPVVMAMGTGPQTRMAGYPVQAVVRCEGMVRFPGPAGQWLEKATQLPDDVDYPGWLDQPGATIALIR
jgi:hypothetical protein